MAGKMPMQAVAERLHDRPTEVEAATERHAGSNTGTNAEPSTTPMQTRFASREELLAYVTEFSLAQGYAVVIHKSNVPRGQLWLRCDLGRTVQEPASAGTTAQAVVATNMRKRKASHRLQNCPFQLYGRRLADGAWVVKVQNAMHTHPLASRKQDLVMHPTARRLSRTQKRLVLELTDLGIRPAVIVERLKARFPDKPIKVQDIYNARNHIRMERLAGRVPFPEATTESGNESEVDAREAALASSATQQRRCAEEELQRLWTTAHETVTHWTEEKQAEFIRNVHGLLRNADPKDGAHTSESADTGVPDVNRDP